MIRGLLSILLVAGFSYLRDQAKSTRHFAGWLRSTTCTVAVRTGRSGNGTTYQPGKVSALQLFTDQQVCAKSAGQASLLLYGQPKAITARDGWWSIPKQAPPASPGQAVYAEFTNRAGIARGEPPSMASMWRAYALLDLRNPNPSPSVAAQVRIAPLAASGEVRTDLPINGGSMALNVSDRIRIEVKNDGSVPLYLYLVDIGPDGTLQSLWPSAGQHSKPLSPTHMWSSLIRARYLELPDQWSDGVERLRLIATSRDVDLSALAMITPVPPASPRASGDPLVYFMRAALGADTTPDPGLWTTALVQFRIQLPN